MQEQRVASPETGGFEFQKWPVYLNAVQFTKEAYLLCRNLKDAEVKEFRDQLRRASQSIVLNLAEGSARFTPADKINFWRISKGSVFECVAILDLLKELGVLKEDMSEQYKKLETIGKMLSGLIRWVRENPRK